MFENLFHHKLKIALSILGLLDQYIFQYRISEVLKIKNGKYRSKGSEASLGERLLLIDFDQFLRQHFTGTADATLVEQSSSLSAGASPCPSRSHERSPRCRLPGDTVSNCHRLRRPVGQRVRNGNADALEVPPRAGNRFHIFRCGRGIRFRGGGDNSHPLCCTCPQYGSARLQNF